jgi:hypothetical protein
MADNLDTPVLFLIFNRPEPTRVVFEQIRKAHPKELFIVADGPRGDKKDDPDKCALTRAVVENVDWECQVQRNYASENMGCGHRVSSGITWAFEQVDRAIILEDDCLPDLSFFRFCEELLELYANDRRIMHISGNNYLPEDCGSPFSYTFSMYPIFWGWATWKRAWNLFDYSMEQWPAIRDSNSLKNILPDPVLFQFWQRNLENVYHSGRDQWGYRWVYSCWVQNGLSIIPSKNLIKNIGFGPEATHTKSTKWLGDLESSNDLAFPLSHPPTYLKNATFESKLIKKLMGIDLAYAVKQSIKYHLFSNRSPRDSGLLSQIFPRK